MRRYDANQSGIWKRQIHTSIVIKWYNGIITKEEIDNLLFMNEPMTLRRIGSLCKILPSEIMTRFWMEIYNWFGGAIFFKSEDTEVFGHIEMADAKSSNKMLRKMFQKSQGNMYSLSYPAYVFCL